MQTASRPSEDGFVLPVNTCPQLWGLFYGGGRARLELDNDDLATLNRYPLEQRPQQPFYHFTQT